MAAVGEIIEKSLWFMTFYFIMQNDIIRLQKKVFNNFGEIYNIE